MFYVNILVSLSFNGFSFEINVIYRGINLIINIIVHTMFSCYSLDLLLIYLMI